MKNREKDDAQERARAQAQPLAEEMMAGVAGGLPMPKPSAFICRKCDIRFSDAHAYYEHMAMVHGK